MLFRDVLGVLTPPYTVGPLNLHYSSSELSEGEGWQGVGTTPSWVMANPR